MSRDSLDAAVSKWLHDSIGNIRLINNTSWPHGNAVVWHVQTVDSEIIIKTHKHQQQYQRELQTYQFIQQQQPDINTAQLINHNAHLRTLVLSYLSDKTLNHKSEAGNNWHSIFKAAGYALAQLHRLSFSTSDTMPLGDAHLLRAQNTLERIRTIEHSSYNWLTQHLAHLSHLNTCNRVWCHRDFQLRNLIWRQGKIHLIDFEASQADWWLSDVERLFNSPEIQNSTKYHEIFFDAYGLTPSEDERHIFNIISAVSALNKLYWSLKHNDEGFERESRQQLQYYKGILG